MRRFIGDAITTAGGVLVLLTALVVMDERVREQVTWRLTSPPSDIVADVSVRFREIAAILAAAAHEQSLIHAPLLLFTVAGVVLVLFMLRT
jgi:hypothetical protein